jgi:hypothetical protein
MSERVVSIADKIKWMEQWCAGRGMRLELHGEVGFGRDCVGVLPMNDESYPDYYWYDKDWNHADKNDDVWCPPKAYHKHECVAVLGQDEDAISQLYEWLQWFERNNFQYESAVIDCKDPVELLMGRDKHHRMVKQ